MSFNKKICLFGGIAWLIFIIISIAGWAIDETPSWIAVLVPSFLVSLFYFDAFMREK
jgi:hypothetical protein